MFAIPNLGDGPQHTLPEHHTRAPHACQHLAECALSRCNWDFPGRSLRLVGWAGPTPAQHTQKNPMPFPHTPQERRVFILSSSFILSSKSENF